ncbi:hypothetical protein G9C84_10085 [Halolamina sp. R1-12]|uniref:Uncharacterized protein n=1 Tax=Halolamina pelagica TaxID=699431 RepID=A0A1I5W080_9EURY|nr:hypothetical protein [Halolamina sp. R1-12]SFQ13101.1 hypothetical protein SAMN05216277_1223 [Halolamina pelagica]
MGLYDDLLVVDDVELPKFPDTQSPTEIEWQTKQIGRPAMKQYKLTATGRLLRREREYREKTAEEKHNEATEQGFDSWDAYVSFCEDVDAHDLVHRGIGVGGPDDQTVDEEFWVDHNMHGSFEFYGKRDDLEDGLYWSYEARFTRGDLNAIVFLGERGGASQSDYKPGEPTRIQF